MPVVSRPQPGRPPRLVYVRSFAGLQYLARRDLCSRRAGLLAACRLHLLHAERTATPQFSPDGRRVAFASNRSGESEIWLADPDGSNAVQLTSMGAQRTGYSPLVSRRRTDCVPLQSRRPVGDLCDPRRGRQASKSHFSSGHRHRPQLLPGRQVDLLQLEPNGRASDLEDPGIRRRCRPGDTQRRVRRLRSRRMAPTSTTLQTSDKPSPLWRLPTSGGHPVKVLEGVFRQLRGARGGIYLSTGLGKEASTISTGPRARPGFSTSTSRPAGPRPWLATSATFGIGLTASPDGRTILYTRVDSSVDDLMLVENFR